MDDLPEDLLAMNRELDRLADFERRISPEVLTKLDAALVVGRDCETAVACDYHRNPLVDDAVVAWGVLARHAASDPKCAGTPLGYAVISEGDRRLIEVYWPNPPEEA